MRSPHAATKSSPRSQQRRPYAAKNKLKKKKLLLLLCPFENNFFLKSWMFGNLKDFLSSVNLELLQGTFSLIHCGDFLMRPVFTPNSEEYYTLHFFIERSSHLSLLYFLLLKPFPVCFQSESKVLTVRTLYHFTTI